MNLKDKITALPGPILIIGASGFIGTNILKRCLEYRSDVVGTYFSINSWRLVDISNNNKLYLNLSDVTSIKSVLNKLKPKVIFDCSSYGAYSFEKNYIKTQNTNYLGLINTLEIISLLDIHAYVHAGSSSEYGLNAAAPLENAPLLPNSHYALSKVAASNAITYYGKIRKLPVINLRLYSVYGPYEDSSRLISQLCLKALKNELPTLADPDVSRDFVFINDVTEAFIDAATQMNIDISGDSINIGTGVKTTLSSLASLSKKLFNISQPIIFDIRQMRDWDVNDWFCNAAKAKLCLKWEFKTSLEKGLLETFHWWKSRYEDHRETNLTKIHKANFKNQNSLTAIIACYKDAKTIPIMYERLITVFKKLDLDYEIIFVNDCSPDETAEVIRVITKSDCRVTGINHSRNFGSQSAFRSGMELATKDACILLDGDLQDPPELIELFVKKWREGADVVYGIRVKREMSRWLEQFYRIFYHIFSIMSDIPVPKNAGDFSLIDKKVIYWILQCKEKDAFLRGLRAYVGFNQIGVEYVRPERMFGTSTNNWIKNIGWAKKGIFSFSRLPLHLLTTFGGLSFIGTILLAIISVLIRIIEPQSVPRGITYLSLLIMFFGSSIILSIGLLGEYIGKIFEETKARPAFIRESITLNGEINPSYLDNS